MLCVSYRIKIRENKEIVKQTERQTNKQTNRGELTTSFAIIPKRRTKLILFGELVFEEKF